MESKHRVYRKHAMTPINFKKKTVKLLRNEQKEPYEMQKSDIFVKKKYKDKCAKDKRYSRLRDHYHYAGE